MDVEVLVHCATRQQSKSVGIRCTYLHRSGVLSQAGELGIANECFPPLQRGLSVFQNKNTVLDELMGNRGQGEDRQPVILESVGPFRVGANAVGHGNGREFEPSSTDKGF